MAKEETKIIAYKGFDKDLKCRGFQYEVGKEYELPEGEEPELCKQGFHACDSPLNVFEYYFLDDNAQFARFCEVEQSGVVKKDKNGEKNVSSKIKIKAELEFADFIKLGIEWIKEKTSQKNVDDDNLNDKGERNAKIGSSGDSAQINSTGKNSVIMCAGYNSMAKAKIGSWITLAEWYMDETDNLWKPKCVKTEYVDGERIKEDTWYKLIDGEFKEVTDNGTQRLYN